MSATQASRRRSPDPPEALVLLYHYVREPSDRPALSEPALDPGAFQSQLDAIERTHRIVGWPEFERRLAGGGDRDPICLLTFDDGLRDHHRTVLPILARRGLAGVFFVLAREPADGLALGHRIHVLLGLLEPRSLAEAILDRTSAATRRAFGAAVDGHRRAGLDEREALKRALQRELRGPLGPILGALVRELVGPEEDVASELYLRREDQADLVAAGMTLGGHGRDHEWLDWVDRPTVDAELRASAQWLARFGAPPWPFAYPFGAPPPRAATVLAAAGFSAAFLAGPRRQGGIEPRYAIPRRDGETLSLPPLARPAPPAPRSPED